MTYVNFSELIGKTLSRVYEGDQYGNDALFFEVSPTEVYAMYHSQDCCESVSIESIEGSLMDLVGSPILQASEECSHDSGGDYSQEWTFYKLATVHGWVDIRWHGRSNGYYSVSVTFVRV